MLTVLPSGQSTAATTKPALSWISHGMAYARHSDGGIGLDTHVFVADANAPDAIGPEALHHVVGMRPARLADDANLPLYNALGEPLFLDLGHWLAARGTATEFADGDGVDLSIHFSHLLVYGLYSVCLHRNDEEISTFIPLKNEDGTSSFIASSEGLLDIRLPLEHDLKIGESLVLVYHSDDLDHDDQPGDFATQAHIQLVATTPNPPLQTPASAQKIEL